MAAPKKTKAIRPGAAEDIGLEWHQGLQFKLAVLFLLLFVLLAAGALWSSRTLVQQNLLVDSYRYDEASGQQLANGLRALSYDAQTLAGSLAQLAATPGMSPEALRNAAPRLLRGRPYAALIADFGIWPEPNTLYPGQDRASLFWTRHETGFQLRNDYNDPRSAPYYHEKWYTPGRYASEERGYWTGIRSEPLSKQNLLTVGIPIRDGRGFLGVATVSLSLPALAEYFAGPASLSAGYSLLLDENNRLLAANGTPEPLTPGTPLAEIAQRQLSYSALALALHKLDEQRHSAISKASLYNASQVSALRDGTRELSRQEAEEILSGIWRGLLPGADQLKAPARIDLSQAPPNGEPAYSILFELPGSNWKLLRITSTVEGFAGANHLFQTSLLVSLALVAMALLAVLLVVRILLVLPLQRMTHQLAHSATLDEALNLVLDESPRNEVGLLAHWQNERVRQLRESIDNARSARVQLSAESHERKNMQEQLLRAQERTALALQAVSDAIITTDEHGVVDDMNPVAELLTGISLREARGQRLEAVLRLQMPGEAEETGNLAELTMRRGSRLDLTEGLRMQPHNAAERDLVLRAAPIRARGRLMGAVLVFQERLRRELGAPEYLSAGQELMDPLTGLRTHSACKRRVTALLEQSGQSHALLYLDLDHLKRINDLGGVPAGDDVLIRVAETLANAAPVSHDVYRLAADQFAVVLEAVDETSALAVAEQLRASLLSARFYWESQPLAVTTSIGVCCFDRQLTALEVLRRADDACVAAKRAGRNRVMNYNPAMDRDVRAVDDDGWVRCIQRGLDEDLFHLRTQWIVAGSDYAAEGHAYEMLLALEDDEGFWAGPAAFMPAAERHQLTPSIDRWVIVQTLRHLRERPELVDSLAFVSINLSALSLVDHGFLEFLAQQLEPQPQLAGKLCFEVREQGLSEHPQAAMLTCEVLHRLGCKVAVDHYFGRHMAELELLRKLPVDFAKIDAQTFKNLGSDPVEQILAESTLRMVRQLRRRVVIYNIDDLKMTETWRKLGADYFQGYAYAKPSPVIFLPPN